MAKETTRTTMARLHWLAVAVIVTTSCFSSGGGCDPEFDACESDGDCLAGEICEPGFLGNACVGAVECAVDADCATGEHCVQRDASPPQNPFDTDLGGKKVCECVDPNCGFTGSTSVSASTSASTSTGGAGGQGGAGGAGGSGSGGSGGAGMGGAGGSGGMGGGA